MKAITTSFLVAAVATYLYMVADGDAALADTFDSGFVTALLFCFVWLAVYIIAFGPAIERNKP